MIINYKGTNVEVEIDDGEEKIGELLSLTPHLGNHILPQVNIQDYVIPATLTGERE